MSDTRPDSSCGCDGSGWISTTDAAGYAKSHPCSCLIERRRLEVLGPRFAMARFERFETAVADIGKRPSVSMLAARNIMAASPTGSYLITGDYGAFKTWLASCQFNWMIDHWPAGSVRFLTDIDLFRSLRDHELGRPATIIPEDFARGRIRHLILDDLGKKNVSDFIRWAYYEIVDTIFRSGGKVGLTITTNSTLGDLAYGADGHELYNPAMIRRIEQYCTLLRVQYGK